MHQTQKLKTARHRLDTNFISNVFDFGKIWHNQCSKIQFPRATAANSFCTNSYVLINSTVKSQNHLKSNEV